MRVRGHAFQLILSILAVQISRGHLFLAMFNLLMHITAIPASQVCCKNLRNDLILHENL